MSIDQHIKCARNPPLTKMLLVDQDETFGSTQEHSFGMQLGHSVLVAAGALLRRPAAQSHYGTL